jgi:hypothetical protein
MKKIFFLAVAFVSLFSSCSKDESNSSNSQIIATINGAKRIFNTVKILNKNISQNSGYYLKVEATIDNKPNEVLTMEFEYSTQNSDIFIASIDYDKDSISDRFDSNLQISSGVGIVVTNHVSSTNLIKGTINEVKFNAITFKDCNYTIYN